MWRLSKEIVPWILAGFILAGCQQPAAEPMDEDLAIGTQGTVTIYQLAQQLGLKVTDIRPTHFTLKNSGDIVVIFTFNDGDVFVNGKSLGPVGEVRMVNRRTLLPASLIPRIRRQLGTAAADWPQAITTYSGTVVIDPGHGGRDPGAIASTGVYEKTITLQVSRKVAALLTRSGLRVVMTRNSDTFIELEDRAEVANEYNADLFASIHADSAHNSFATGFTVYVSSDASWSARRAAEMIEQAMEQVGSDNRGVREADYRVLVHTDGPAVLIELGYLSNYEEALRLADSNFQNRLAAAIAQGITDYLAGNR